jgi:exopolysaccharide biosynthesis polyprenyl glycosylphosphotransferase
MKSLLRRYGRSVTYLLITDWLILVGTFGLAYHWRHYNRALNIISRYHIVPEAFFAMLYAFCILGIFGALRLYKRKTWMSRPWHLLRITQGTAICILGYLLLGTLIKSPVFIESRLVTLNWSLLLFSALIIHRVILFPPMMQAARRAQMQRRVVIIGAGEAGIGFTRMCLAQHQYTTLKPVGFLSNHRVKGETVLEDLTCLGLPEDLPDIVELYKVEGAVITQTDLSYQALMDLIERCIRLFGWVDVHTDKSAVLHDTLDTDTYFDVPFVRLAEIRNGFLIRAYKETTDLIGAAIGIVLLSPVLLAAALAVKLTSPGPVLYTHKRVGKNGKLFEFYKFRSMYTGADQDPTRQENLRSFIQEEDGSPMRKVVNEQFITPVGRFLRKWAIDELPQLFNVIKGDMSLIGPRPVPPSEFEMNDEWHKRRYDIKPGCTGLWKVYAVREEGTIFAHTVLYDLYYSRNINPLLDLYIVIMTVWVILTGKADG